MSVFFIFLIGVLNLGLGFGAAVVVKRRCDSRLGVKTAARSSGETSVEEPSSGDIHDTAEEAIEAVEELLSQVGLEAIGDSDSESPDDEHSDDLDDFGLEGAFNGDAEIPEGDDDGPAMSIDETELPSDEEPDDGPVAT